MTDVLLKAKDIKPLRDKLLKEQEGICPICKKPVDSPCLDHFHKRKLGGDGKIRGVVCLGCNILISKGENACKRCKISLEELPDVLINIGEYLKKPRLALIHPSEAPLYSDQYQLIQKYYLEVYPKKRKIPDYPNNGLMTKDFKKILKDIEKFLNGKDKKKKEAKKTIKNSKGDKAKKQNTGS